MDEGLRFGIHQIPYGPNPRLAYYQIDLARVCPFAVEDEDWEDPYGFYRARVHIVYIPSRFAIDCIDLKNYVIDLGMKELISEELVSLIVGELSNAEYGLARAFVACEEKYRTNGTRDIVSQEFAPAPLEGYKRYDELVRHILYGCHSE